MTKVKQKCGELYSGGIKSVKLFFSFVRCKVCPHREMLNLFSTPSERFFFAYFRIEMLTDISPGNRRVSPGGSGFSRAPLHSYWYAITVSPTCYSGCAIACHKAQFCAGYLAQKECRQSLGACLREAPEKG
ncbi:hypothetical protein XU18_4712 [Perkinsela sp. CCAP 1560/4]|nr:hypothetical protein XU18_4712 [Perkinsela sp. CCAP 1560/4]|eukprot:KNH03955.1 hypothetical protein XU18_4712 [Perkinsela sp. CCAP 1560/4]